MNAWLVANGHDPLPAEDAELLPEPAATPKPQKPLLSKPEHALLVGLNRDAYLRDLRQKGFIVSTYMNGGYGWELTAAGRAALEASDE